jgi:hypothetical protein
MYEELRKEIEEDLSLGNKQLLLIATLGSIIIFGLPYLVALAMCG